MTLEERQKEGKPTEGINDDGTDIAFWRDFLSEEEMKEIERMLELRDKQE